MYPQNAIESIVLKGGIINKSDRRVKGLGEVSIRVKDLDAMQKFYEEVIGLEVLRRDESFIFFKIAEGYAGHTQNLALFDASNRMFLENKSPQLISVDAPPYCAQYSSRRF